MTENALSPAAGETVEQPDVTDEGLADGTVEGSVEGTVAATVEGTVAATVEGSAGASEGESGAAPAGASTDESVGESGADSGRGDHGQHDDLVAEGDAAGDYLERLLDILDYDGDIDLDVEGERAVVSIIGGGDVQKLVGDHGEVLDALQELTRLAVGMETGQRSRLMLDIAGYRAKRRAELEELARETATQVVASGTPVKLGAMNPFERKVVHDAIATIAGVTSASEGVEPHRRVVVSPAAAN